MVLLNEREEHLQCIIYAASQSYNPPKKDRYMEINIFLYRTERLKISVTNRCLLERFQLSQLVVNKSRVYG